MRSSLKPAARGRAGTVKAPWGSSTRANVKRRSRGAVLLTRVPLRDSKIAELLSVPRDVVTRWKNGERIPGAEYRRIMQAEFGIAEESWDEDGRSPAPPLAAKLPSFDEQCAQMSRLVHRLIERAEYFEREGDPKLAARYTRDGVAALVQLGKLTGASLEITSAKAIRIPVVRLFVDKVVRALRDCPEGLKLVVAVLEENESANANAVTH